MSATLYAAANLLTGPGTVFAAPLGTTEPTACSGDWPAGWVALGYTQQGSDFDWKPTVNPLTPEEEYWPSLNLFTAYEAHMKFSLLEMVLQSWQLAMNQGIGSSAQTGTVTTLSDGSKKIAFGDVGTETRVMVGWDSYNKGSTAASGTPSGPLQGRIVVPQAIQVGQVQINHRKGANPQMLGLDFQIEKKDGATEPFSIIVPAALV